ncbi:cytochrome D1 domain-containing protein [Aromatoleum evansii]|uniref:cytochrome D1 domain-containing protein n=1 Tax=Aromatoleum evansii TaxID=59406 RepID=UPI0030DCFA2B
MSKLRFATLSLLVSCALSGTTIAAPAPASVAADAKPAASGRLVRDGVAIDFEARPAGGASELVEGGLADIRFRITDANTGKGVPGLQPGAWLDLAQVISNPKANEQKECKDKIALYLKGVVGVRPMVDLNSYYLMVLNKDPSISVIDPLTSVGGVTSTLTRIMLKRPPVDWTKSPDGKYIFVSMPVADQVAVVDATSFRVVTNVDAGDEPVRVTVQPDGRYLWVGNNSRDPAKSGVTVIDAHTFKPVKTFATGKGHHEIAFSDDSRHAFVTSRDAGTVSVFDVATMQKLKDLATGPRPISVAQSGLSKALYVADGQAGTITVIDARTLATRKVIQAKPGLGPVRFTADGRYGFALNTLESVATVVDAGSDEVVHDIKVASEPYQVTFTSGYAYVRGLATERVTMVKLDTLGKGRAPVLQSFAAGGEAPKLAGDLPLAASLAARNDEGSVFVVNPANNTTYFYMEGMNAPMTGYLNRGHTARAVTVVDRAMKQGEPGVFSTQVTLPASGKFDVAFMLDRPQVLHCFSAEVKPGVVSDAKLAVPRLEFLPSPVTVQAPGKATVRFRLVAGRKDTPRTGLTDLKVSYFVAPAGTRQSAAAREVGEGVYEAQVQLGETGAYYVHVDSEALRDTQNKPYLTLRAVSAVAGK